MRRGSTLTIEKKKSLLPHLVPEAKMNEGGPGKCGRLFCKYWVEHKPEAKVPSTKIPDVDVKFKIYRLGCFDQKEGTFYCDFVLMLDWVDESLSLVAEGEVPDFKNHFWPKVELMNMIPGEDDLDFTDQSFWPKLKKDKNAEGLQVHRASITIKARRSLFCRLDYHNFPFDRQVLELTIKMLSVRIPMLKEETGTRPTVRHPKRWRGTTKDGKKELGHEMIPEADWLPEFEFIRLASKCYSSKFGPNLLADDEDLKKKFLKALKKFHAGGEGSRQKYYQDTYTLQLIMARDAKNVLWNLCFSLFVIDVMVFTAHGIPMDELGDRLAVNLTLLLTAMAFKWVLNDQTPNVPYLTVMERYVVLTFTMLFVQGVAFWFLSDGYSYRCGAEDHTGETETYKDWWSGRERFTNETFGEDDGGSKKFWEMTCEGIHVADRVILFTEVLAWFCKNSWFFYKMWQPHFTTCKACCKDKCCPQGYSALKKKTGFVDLRYLKEYHGKHHQWVGHEEQINEVGVITSRSNMNKEKESRVAPEPGS